MFCYFCCHFLPCRPSHGLPLFPLNFSDKLAINIHFKLTYSQLSGLCFCPFHYICQICSDDRTFCTAAHNVFLPELWLPLCQLTACPDQRTTRNGPPFITFIVFQILSNGPHWTHSWGWPQHPLPSWAFEKLKTFQHWPVTFCTPLGSVTTCQGCNVSNSLPHPRTH